MNKIQSWYYGNTNLVAGIITAGACATLLVSAAYVVRNFTSPLSK